MLTRRNLFKQSAFSAVTLLALESCYSSPEIPPAPEGLGHDFEFLTPKKRGILSKLTPVILADGLPTTAEQKALAVSEIIVGWDIAVSGLTPLIQAEIRKLFSVLDSNFILSLTPRLITGVPGAWDDPKEIDDFLNNWRFSDPQSILTGKDLRVGYMAMVELTVASWYANPRSWGFCGYAGPPVLF